MRLPLLEDYLKEGAVINGLIRLEDDFFDIKRIESGFHGAGIRFEKEVKHNKEHNVDDVWYTIKNYHQNQVREKVWDIVMRKKNRLNSTAPDSAAMKNSSELTTDVMNAILKTSVKLIDKTRDQVIRHLSRVYGLKEKDIESVLNKADYRFADESKKLVEIGALELGGGSERAMDNTLDNVAYAADKGLPSFENWFSNYGGFGVSPKQMESPFLTFDRMPPYYAYMRQNASDLE